MLDFFFGNISNEPMPLPQEDREARIEIPASFLRQKTVFEKAGNFLTRKIASLKQTIQFLNFRIREGVKNMFYLRTSEAIRRARQAREYANRTAELERQYKARHPKLAAENHADIFSINEPFDCQNTQNLFVSSDKTHYFFNYSLFNLESSERAMTEKLSTLSQIIRMILAFNPHITYLIFTEADWRYIRSRPEYYAIFQQELSQNRRLAMAKEKLAYEHLSENERQFLLSFCSELEPAVIREQFDAFFNVLQLKLNNKERREDDIEVFLLSVLETVPENFSSILCNFNSLCRKTNYKSFCFIPGSNEETKEGTAVSSLNEKKQNALNQCVVSFINALETAQYTSREFENTLILETMVIDLQKLDFSAYYFNSESIFRFRGILDKLVNLNPCILEIAFHADNHQDMSRITQQLKKRQIYKQVKGLLVDYKEWQQQTRQAEENPATENEQPVFFLPLSVEKVLDWAEQHLLNEQQSFNQEQENFLTRFSNQPLLFNRANACIADIHRFFSAKIDELRGLFGNKQAKQKEDNKLTLSSGTREANQVDLEQYSEEKEASSVQNVTSEIEQDNKEELAQLTLQATNIARGYGIDFPFDDEDFETKKTHELERIFALINHYGVNACLSEDFYCEVLYKGFLGRKNVKFQSTVPNSKEEEVIAETEKMQELINNPQKLLKIKLFLVHPDKNGNDIKATIVFKALTAMMDTWASKPVEGKRLKAKQAAQYSINFFQLEQGVNMRKENTKEFVQNTERFVREVNELEEQEKWIEDKSRQIEARIKEIERQKIEEEYKKEKNKSKAQKKLDQDLRKFQEYADIKFKEKNAQNSNLVPMATKKTGPGNNLPNLGKNDDKLPRLSNEEANSSLNAFYAPETQRFTTFSGTSDAPNPSLDESENGSVAKIFRSMNEPNSGRN